MTVNPVDVRAPQVDVLVDWGVPVSFRVHTDYSLAGWTAGICTLRTEPEGDPVVSHSLDESMLGSGFLTANFTVAELEGTISGVWYTIEGVLDGVPRRLQRGQIRFEEQVG
jgi:hypothetical protein